MKKIVILILIFVVFALYSETIIKINDEIGDDYGSGQISYPEDPMFVDGIFDIISFQIEKETDNYLFKFKLNGEISPLDHDEFQYNYNLSDDFILPMIHIYIDQDHVEGSGFTSTINGTNARINAENAWEKVVVIAAMPDRFKGSLVRSQPDIAHNAIIPDAIKISRDKHWISVKISDKLIDEISPDWGFTVVMLCQAFSQTIDKSIYIKDIKTTTSTMNFGGGTGNFLKNYDPNIIDMITPLGKDQRNILKNYDEDKKKYVEIFAYYPEYTKVTINNAAGEVKQVSQEKVVVDMGSENGIFVGSILLIDNRIVVTVSDIFPNLSIAKFNNSSDWQSIEEGMSVTVKK